MKRKTELFRDTQALATFSNISTTNEAEYFHHNFPAFLPERFWNWRVALPKGDPSLGETPLRWQVFQYILRETWHAGFPLEKCVALISDKIPDEEGNALDTKVWPFQKAVMVLGIEPWRAKFCTCGRRFVADKPSRRFCSDRCSSDARKASQRSWWNEHGDKWREKRNRQAKQKSERKTQ
jgi:hypothetical protein